MKNYKTEQEYFWAGNFGDEYASRNSGPKLLATKVHFFSKVIARTQNIKSVIEYGANIGENLKAIKQLLPKAELAAVEINKSACMDISKWAGKEVKVYNKSILAFKTTKKYDLVFVKGVLIHINPDELHNIYDSMYNTSSKYILIDEYYNITPLKVEYRGNKDKLCKRDFCSEMMIKYPKMQLIDYGFTYHRDPNFPDDDSNWFLLKKE
jgi:spore coat polysaccharide biosynthesis protein SpsF